MLLAWSATETIRYTYFFGLLGGLDELGGLPRWLKWARYNTFFVLYPMGIASECYLLYQSIPLARMEVDERAAWVLCGILAAYVPGAMVLYSHMMRQRRKVMRQEKGRQEDWKKTQ